MSVPKHTADSSICVDHIAESSATLSLNLSSMWGTAGCTDHLLTARAAGSLCFL